MDIKDAYMDVGGRVMQEQLPSDLFLIFPVSNREPPMTEGITFHLKHSDPLDLITVFCAQSILKGKNHG